MTIACVVCTARSPEPVGVLCAPCAATVAQGERRAPGIVTVRELGVPAAWLIDMWGQLHAIPRRCRVGRAPDNDVVIADLGVSAEHAVLDADEHGWTVVDCESSNGTLVGRRRCRGATRIGVGERLAFGAIGFFLWPHTDPPVHEVPAPHVRTIVPAGAAFELASKHGMLRIRAADGHRLAIAPGELAFVRRDSMIRRAALPRLQFQLLRVLCEAAVTSTDDESAFVGSHSLLAALPFRSGRPAATHVRQVVATVRARLARLGVTGAERPGPDGVIHGKEGLGYRVSWAVTPLVEAG